MTNVGTINTKYTIDISQAKQNLKNIKKEIDKIKKVTIAKINVQKSIEDIKKIKKEINKIKNNNIKLNIDNTNIRQSIQNLKNMVRQNLSIKAKLNIDTSSLDNLSRTSRLINVGLMVNTANLDAIRRDLELRLRLQNDGNNGGNNGNRNNQNNNSVTEAIKKIGTDITTSLSLLGATTIATTKNFLVEARGYELGYSSVLAKLNLGKDSKEAKELEKLFLHLGATTAASNMEVVNAAGVLAQNGLSQKQILVALPTTIKTGIANNVDFASVADISTTVMSAFGKKAEDLNMINDMLTKASNSGTASYLDIGESIKYGAEAFTKTNTTISKSLAILNSLADTSVKGSMAGTTTTSVINDIYAKSKDGKIKVGNKMVDTHDKNGQAVQLDIILKNILKAVEGLSQKDKVDALSFFGVEASRAFAAYETSAKTGKNLEHEKNIVESKGTVSKMEADMMDNIDGEMKKLEAAWSSFKIEVIKDLSPAIIELSNNLQSLMDKYKNLDKDTRDNIASAVVFAAKIGVLSAAISVLSFVLGPIIKLFALVGTAVKFIIPLMTALFIKFKKIGDILIVIRGLIMAVVGLVTSTVGAVVMAVLAVVGAIASVVVALSNLFNRGEFFSKRFFKEILNNVDFFVQSAKTKLFDFVIDIMDKIPMLSKLLGLIGIDTNSDKFLKQGEKERKKMEKAQAEFDKKSEERNTSRKKQREAENLVKQTESKIKKLNKTNPENKKEKEKELKKLESDLKKYKKEADKYKKEVAKSDKEYKNYKEILEEKELDYEKEIKKELEIALKREESKNDKENKELISKMKKSLEQTEKEIKKIEDKEKEDKKKKENEKVELIENKIKENKKYEEAVIKQAPVTQFYKKEDKDKEKVKEKEKEIERIKKEKEQAEKEKEKAEEERINTINKNIDALNQSTDTIKKSIGVFERFNNREKISPTRLLREQKTRTDAFIEFDKIKNELNNRKMALPTKDLINNLSVADLKYLRAINNMSTSQFAEFDKNNQREYSISQNQAIKQNVNNVYIDGAKSNNLDLTRAAEEIVKIIERQAKYQGVRR